MVRGLRKRVAQRAGLRESALTLERTTATQMVTANCRYNWPEMPGRKAIGTKTANRTKVVATMGPVIWCIDLSAASLGPQLLLLHKPLDILHHDDGVVHHQSDGQDQSEQGNGVGAESHHQHYGKRADEGNRNGQCWY